MLTFFSSLIACGGGSSSDKNSDDNVDTTTGIINANNTPTILEGTWHKACGPIESQFPEDGYDIVTITFTLNQLYSDIENYIDASCSQPFPDLPNPTAYSIIAIGEEVMTTGGLMATQVDTEITQSSNPDVFVDRTYDIFYIDTDNLYLGDYEADTPENRTNTLSFDRVFVRQ